MQRSLGYVVRLMLTCHVQATFLLHHTYYVTSRQGYWLQHNEGHYLFRNHANAVRPLSTNDVKHNIVMCLLTYHIMVPGYKNRVINLLGNKIVISWLSVGESKLLPHGT